MTSILLLTDRVDTRLLKHWLNITAMLPVGAAIKGRGEIGNPLATDHSVPIFAVCCGAFKILMALHSGLGMSVRSQST